jgi:hypothetical protein
VRFLPFVLLVALTIYAAIDCLRTPEPEVKAVPKPVWLLAILFVVLVGPVLWLLAGRDRGKAPRTAPRGPVAPDDDPDFLRRIDENRRLRQWEDDLKRREDEMRRGDDETA